MIEESKDLNEYAFALGALSHYAADGSGHQLATNRAVAIMYPGLAKKYGPVVTYQEKPSAHMKVEYGFDVDQVAEGNYAPKAYHDFIGFEVSKPVLERAFAKTYSLEMSDVFFGLDLSIGSYRHAVSTVIPRMTKVAWHLKRDEIRNSQPSETKKEFIYNISNSGYRKEWGHIYEKPGFGTRLKAFFLRFVPKVGPFSGLAFHPPPPAVEQLYMESFNETLATIARWSLRNRKTGSNCPMTTSILEQSPEQPLMGSLTKHTPSCSTKRAANESRTPCAGTFSLITRDLEKPIATKRNSKAWHKLIKELDTLKSTPQAETKRDSCRD